MATLYFDKPLQIDAKAAWLKLSDLKSVHKLVSILEGAHMEGDRRVCDLKAGLPVAGRLEEIIYSVDQDRLRVAYGITASPFGFTHHSASMQIVPEGMGRSRFVWITDVKPDDVPERMGPIFAQEAEHIARALEK